MRFNQLVDSMLDNFQNLHNTPKMYSAQSLLGLELHAINRVLTDGTLSGETEIEVKNREGVGIRFDRLVNTALAHYYELHDISKTDSAHTLLNLELEAIKKALDGGVLPGELEIEVTNQESTRIRTEMY